jgi:RHS repeat-associated protein
MEKKNLPLLKILMVFILFIFLLLPSPALPYNWPWDQGHDCVETAAGSGSWGKYDYDGVFHGTYSSKECCELLCKICPVYANTGALQKTYTDLSVPGIGPALRIVRTYNSQDWATSLLGHGWIFNFGRELIIIRNKAWEKIIGVRLETGEKNFFKENVDGTLERLTAYGVTYDLIKNTDGTYTIKNRDGSRHELRTDGKISRIIDKNNNQLIFEYNSVGCLSKITNASGNYVTLQLGPNGKIASISDNLGRTISYTYDQNGNLASSTDPMGNITQYAYNSNNLLAQIIDPRGNVIESATYDNNQPPRVSTFTEKGETYTIAYFDGRTEKTDSQGNKWTYYFNDVGVITKVIDPLGNVTEQLPNKVTSTSLDWKADANGNITHFTYDANGNMTSKTDPLGNTWIYTYVPGTSLVATETNPLGVVTKYEYDVNGNVIRLTRDFRGLLENTTTFAYDIQGNQTSITNPLGHTTSYEYDAAGNLIKATDPMGNVRSYTYDARGNKLTETDPKGSRVIYSYDLLDRLISVTDALGNSTGYTYDANGNQEKVRLPNGEEITYQYDSNNRLIKTSDPLGNTQTYAYDNKNNLVLITDANGNKIQYGYDSFDRRINITDEESHQTTYVYDAAGNMISVTDAKGNKTDFIYDANNRLIRKTYPDGASYTYAYDALGRKITQTDPNGNTINLIYDRLNRMVQKQYPDGNTADFTYDLMGRMLSGSNSDSTLSYIFDPLGRVVSSNQNGKTVQYTYDASGSRIFLTTPEGESVQYSYNDANLMTQMQLSNGKRITYTYSAVGGIIRIDYTGGAFTTKVFDKAGRLANTSHNNSTGTEIYFQGNTFDNVGNIVKKTTEEGDTSYNYNKIYQLTDVDNPTTDDEHFRYDAVGNRLTSADHTDWTYNNRNELINYGGITYTYDSNGNTVSRTEAGGTTVYQYNYENRLSRVDFPNGGHATYKYDIRSRRIEKSVDGVVTKYLYDGDRLLAEYDASGSLKRNYFNGALDFNPSMLVEGGRLYFYVKDHLGTPQKVVNESGNIEWSAEYTSFGNANITVNSVTNNFRFPGQYFDQETGLHYNQYRYYDVQTGRYLRVDPIRLMGGINLYIYADLNPVNSEDPMGLYSITISRDEYWTMWKASHPGLTPEQYRDLENVLNRGCIGITDINLFEFGNASLSDCYATFAQAKQRQDQMRGECTCQRNITLMGKPGGAKMFSKRFWSSGDPYTPDPSTGKVDMSGYSYRARPGYVNFDYGWYDESANLWIHANHFHDPGGMGPMKVYYSDLEHYSRPLLDFDKQFFCVACEN